MNEKNRQAVKTFAVIGSIIVYVAFVVYSEYHFYNLVATFLPGGAAQLVGYLAVGVTGLTAIFLPLALHFWVRSGNQKLAGWIFYGAHFLFVAANMVLDSAANAGIDLGAFFNIYGTYILPAVTAIYAIGWIVVWAFDPQVQRFEEELDVRETEVSGKHARRKTLAEMKTAAVASAFQSPAAQRAINSWAARNAPQLIADELGVSLDELGQVGDFRWWVEEPGEAQARELAPPRRPQLVHEVLTTQQDLEERLRSQGLSTDGAHDIVRRLSIDDARELVHLVEGRNGANFPNGAAGG